MTKPLPYRELEADCRALEKELASAGVALTNYRMEIAAQRRLLRRAAVLAFVWIGLTLGALVGAWLTP